MPDTHTSPGQICYAAYVLARHWMSADDAAYTYARSVPKERAAWEAAAQAVRASDRTAPPLSRCEEMSHAE